MYELIVPRASLSLERLFERPPDCVAAPLVDSSTGSASRLRTTVAAYRDATRLFVLFEAEDDALSATILARDGNLYEEDVVEVFLATERLERYFEFEVNPLATLFDARVDSPHRDRSSMHVDREWNAPSFCAAIRRQWSSPQHCFSSTLLSIPFADLGATPDPDSSWRANFYRIDRHVAGDLFLAWSPPRRTPPDFHVPDAFGTLRFL